MRFDFVYPGWLTGGCKIFEGVFFVLARVQVEQGESKQIVIAVQHNHGHRVLAGFEVQGVVEGTFSVCKGNDQVRGRDLEGRQCLDRFLG